MTFREINRFFLPSAGFLVLVVVWEVTKRLSGPVVRHNGRSRHMAKNKRIFIPACRSAPLSGAGMALASL
jgi:hypothetical protein